MNHNEELSRLRRQRNLVLFATSIVGLGFTDDVYVVFWAKGDRILEILEAQR